MSIQAVGAVLNIDADQLNGPPRFVLLVLSDHAGRRDGSEYLECWPSVARVAAQSALNEQTVRRAIRWLVEEGWIFREVNAAPDDRIPQNKRPNLYRLGPWSEGSSRATTQAEQGSSDRLLGSYSGQQQGSSGATTKPSKNHKEPRGSDLDNDERFSAGSGPIPKVVVDDTELDVAGAAAGIEKARNRIHRKAL